MNPARFRSLVHSRARTVFLASAVVFAVGLAVWPGCVTAPLPSSRQLIGTRQKSDFAFAKRERPTRSEVISRVGEPDAYVADIRVVCYRVNHITQRKLWLLFGILPVGGRKIPHQVEVAVIQFGEDDRARRYEMTTTHENVRLNEFARFWLRRKENEGPR